MRKLIYDINVTLDGIADHTAGIVDNELHDFFTNLLGTADTLLFGRKTYQLMESYWPNARKDPDADDSTIAFADQINSMPKIVFSKTLNKVSWDKTTLIKEDAVEAILRLKQQPGGPLLIGGIDLPSTIMKAGLIDEHWLLVHPVIAGKGRKLFESVDARHELKLMESIKFRSGVIALHYAK